MTPLRQRFIDTLEAKGFSMRTVDNYVNAVIKISKFHNKSPLLFTEDDVRAFILHELKPESLAPRTVELHRCALITFYRLVAPEINIMQNIGRIKLPKHLPVVLSRDEVERMIGALHNIKHKAVVAVLYSAGLRLGECAALKVSDIDSGRMSVRVEMGKGKKDRYSILSQRALEILRNYVKIYRPKEWLFRGRDICNPIHRRSIQKIVENAGHKAGICKNIHPHTMRHSFATHLLEAGVQLQIIQQLLGHSNLKTTTIYTHVTSVMLQNVKSPFDMIPEPAKGAVNA